MQTLSVVVRKIYQGETDLMPETVHEKLKIALAHDHVRAEGDKFIGEVVQDGDYQIAWPDFLDYPIGKGAFSAEVKAFDAVNSNCASCDDFIGLTVNNDRYENAYGELIPLTEGGTYDINVAENDEICCDPVEFSIVEYNTLYVDTISIDQDGLVTFTLKTGLPTLGQVDLFTYRVTCPNDNYDEGVCVIAIDGTVISCEPPQDLLIGGIAPTEATAQWDPPLGGTPSGGYEWELYEADDLLTPVQTGTHPDELALVLTGLSDGVQYVFQVRSVCAYGSSPYVSVAFTTPPESESCGRYEVYYNDGSGIRGNFTIVSYIGCDGQPKTQAVYNDMSEFICALQVSEGDPVTITGATEIFYITTC